MGGNHDVEFIPPTRTAGSPRRPSTRREGRAQELLSRLSIMDPRTRKHLFVHVAFCNPGNIQSWKSTFPDPSTFPACYTKSLSVRCPHVVTPADAEENGWIRAFSRVVSFEVMITEEGGFERLVPFHGFSPLIYSLTVAFSPLQPRAFSTSSAHSFFSETWLCSTSVVPLSLRMPALVGIWP